VHLKQQLDEKRQDVESLKVQLEAAQLAKKETQQPAEISQPAANGTNRPSRMRSLVPDEYYIERDEAERLLKRFAIALKEPQKQPLLFNIYGIGGVGKTTLLGRLQQAHMEEVDFLEVCFAKTSNIETPLKLMGKLHQQARQLVSEQTIADAFTQQQMQFEKALSQLSQSVDGETTNPEDARKITSWFERFVWLSPTGFTASKPKSWESSGSGFSAFSAIANDTESLQEWIQQQYLLGKDGLGLQEDAQQIEVYFEWLKNSDFVEFSKGQYRLDDVARDVFRQSYFQGSRSQFYQTNVLLADYFKQQADVLFPPPSPLPDSYEDEEWRKLIAEYLYYSLFGKRREGLQQYIEQIFAAVYLEEPDLFMAPLAFISAEMNTGNQNLLLREINTFFEDLGMFLSFGWRFLNKSPKSYKIEVEVEHIPSSGNCAISARAI
ncbi:MAG: hypothetical protein F6J86_42520, partial [Symploca sp. SIO1B1]|nr:hypothetical protein [Symploca sp. SIO1B1]